MDNYDRAVELTDEIIRHRRVLHRIAEVGMELPKTVAYVMEELKNMGYEPKRVGKSGVSALAGKGEKTILLRADMDALPIREESGLPFAATGGTCHACGHDIHTAVLLGAARMVKEREDELNGCVKFMFQPGEELMEGASDMVAAGILENPRVDCALALHTKSTKEKGIAYTPGVRYASCSNFSITVKGVAAHGAMPYNGVDPIVIASHMVLAMQELVSREIPFNEGAVLTVCQIQGGCTYNAVPGEVELKGTMRSFCNKTREYLKKRLPELIQDTARAYRGTAQLQWVIDAPVLKNDPVLTDLFAETMGELGKGRFPVYEMAPTTGSEDFAVVAERVPAFMFNLALPDPDSEIQYGLHHPKIRFDESFMPAGAGALVECAMRWLEVNS